MVDAGPEPTYKEKMRVPLPWDSNALFLTIILHLFVVLLDLW